MKKFVIASALFLCSFLCFSQEVSFRDIDKEGIMMFSLEQDDIFMGIYFWANDENFKNYCCIETINRKESPNVKDIDMRYDIISPSRANLYSKGDELLFIVVLANEHCYLYGKDDKFIVKLPHKQ